MVGLVRRASPLPLRVRRRFLRAHPQSRAIRSYAIKDIAVGKNEPAVEQPLYRFTTIGSDMSVMQGLRCSVRIRCDAADPSSKSQISWHYRNSLSMYGAKVGVLRGMESEGRRCRTWCVRSGEKFPTRGVWFLSMCLLYSNVGL